MKIRSAMIFAGAISLAIWAGRGAIAADLTDVGYIDQADLANLPVFVGANRQLAAYKSQLDSQYNAQLKRARTDAGKQQVAMQIPTRAQRQTTRNRRAAFSACAAGNRRRQRDAQSFDHRR